MKNVLARFDVEGASVQELFKKISEHLDSDTMKLPSESFVWLVVDCQITEERFTSGQGGTIRRALTASVEARMVSRELAQ